MMLYKRSKLAINIFRNFSSRITPPKNPIQESIFPTTISAPFLRRSSSLNHGFLKQNKVNPFLENGSKRFYCVDKPQISHSSFIRFKEWFDPVLEMVPYIKRNQFLLFSKSFENKFSEIMFNWAKETEYDGKILPATHPESMRVRLIANDIIGALQKGLNKENTWVQQSRKKGEESDGSGKSGGEGSLKALSNEVISERGSSKADEMLDDQWVQQSRKKGKENGVVDATSHLDGLNWEVLVVDDEPDPSAPCRCLPGGKIFVFKGTLEHLKSDAEIATVIGHEVGHIVAQHVPERLTKMFLSTTVFLSIAPFLTLGQLAAMSICNHFLSLPNFRRMYTEADRIGLLLIASAGYDPQVAPTVYEKLGKVTGAESPWNDYLDSQPCTKTRTRVLTQPKVMEEALLTYREFLSGKDVKIFH